MTDDLDECPHSMVLTPDTCAMCREQAAGPPPKPYETGRAFLAKYESDCPGCNLPILPRQIIRQWTDDLYRHAGGKTPCTP